MNKIPLSSQTEEPDRFVCLPILKSRKEKATEDMHRDDSETGPYAVDSHITDRGAPVCDEGLVVFVSDGENDADKKYSQQERASF